MKLTLRALKAVTTAILFTTLVFAAYGQQSKTARGTKTRKVQKTIHPVRDDSVTSHRAIAHDTSRPLRLLADTETAASARSRPARTSRRSRFKPPPQALAMDSDREEEEGEEEEEE